MTTDIRLKSSAFAPGAPFAEFATCKTKAKIILANRGAQGLDLGAFANVQYTDHSLYTGYPNGSLVITVNGAIVENVQLRRMTQTMKNTLANYVSKNLVVVTQNGVVLTSLQVQNLSELPNTIKEVVDPAQIDSVNMIFTTVHPYTELRGVWTNGMQQYPGVGFAIDWTPTAPSTGTITASAAPTTGDIVVFEYLPE